MKTYTLRISEEELENYIWQDEGDAKVPFDFNIEDDLLIYKIHKMHLEENFVVSPVFLEGRRVIITFEFEIEEEFLKSLQV